MSAGARRALAATAVGTVMVTPPAAAHAFGGRYDLPLPLSLLLLAAGLAVALSFVVMAVCVRAGPAGTASGSRYLVLSSGLATALRVLPVATLSVLLAAAGFGSPQVYDNITPTFVWVIFWVGFAFLAAAFGDLWRLLNPWHALAALLNFRGRWRLPRGVGVWPALALFLGFAWLELVFDGSEQPRLLGALIIAYTLFLLGGMWAFGPVAWLRAADIFENVFGLIGRFGVLRVRHAGSFRPRVHLQPPAAGLLVSRVPRFSQTLFVICLLATVSYDGVLETPAWAAFIEWVETSPLARPLLLFALTAGWDLLQFVQTLALLGAPLALLGAYLSCMLFVRVCGGARVGFMDVVNGFALSIVPIAIAYHLAHYLSYLLIAGQHLIPLLSDPFGWGWDLFGARRYRIDVGIVSPKFTWWFAAIAVVVGHVASVVVAHLQALRLYGDTRRALFSQFPMIVLMIAYTMLSLWILSQPIIEVG